MAGAIAQRLERTLLPSPDGVAWNQGNVQQVSLTTCNKIQYFSGNLLKFVGYMAALPFAAVYSMGKWAVSCFNRKPQPAAIDPTINPSVLPAHFGFADSLFQTSGLGTQASATPLTGVCNWEKWLNPKRIEGTTAGEYRRFFVDVLRNPEPFIAILRQTNVTAHRFSLEWSVIEPRKGVYNPEAVGLYWNFIQRLQENGIEPYVTLHHFVCPEWFDQEGGFAKMENVDRYKNHALRMMELFPIVTNWMPFNEINVNGLQVMRDVYPPGGEDVAGAGRRMRNMLLAHCKIYKEAKARWPHLQIGSSHQWLNFKPMEGNPLEKAICYFLSKVTHYACYNFFKTGQFSLEMPGQANVQFSIPKEEFQRHNGFGDFMGVQFYGLPRLKAGFNGGHAYPGYKVTNLNFWKFGLTFGSTCPPGGEAQSFGPSFSPESIEECLNDAVALNKPIVISETGCDAKVQKWGEKEWTVSQETQRRYFEKILPILTKFRNNLKGFFTWTVTRGHLEWDRGAFPILGTVNILRQNQQIVGHTLSPAAELLRDVYGRKRAELAQGVQAIA